MLHLSTHYLNAKRANPWDRTITVTQTTRKTKKKVTNQIFKECAEKDESKYWKAIFDNASVGKFHTGYSFKNNILTCKNGNQVKEVILPEDIDIAIQVCKEFFNQNTGLLSPKEKMEERKNERQNKEKTKDSVKIKWVNVKKHRQPAYIRSYVQQLAITYNFTEEEKIRAINFINYNILIKNLSTTHFDFNGTELVKINNILFNSVTRQWSIEKVTKSKTTATSKNVSKSASVIANCANLAVSGSMTGGSISGCENVKPLHMNWRIQPRPAEFDIKFKKEIDAIYKPKTSEFLFVPQSVSTDSASAA